MMVVALVLVAAYSAWVGMVVVNFHSENTSWQEQQRK